MMLIDVLQAATIEEFQDLWLSEVSSLTYKGLDKREWGFRGMFTLQS